MLDPRLPPLLSATADRAWNMLVVGVCLALFSVALARIRAEGRTNFVVQHRAFAWDQLREAAWSLANPFLLLPLATVQTVWLVDRVLAPYVPHQPFAPWITSLPFAVQVVTGALVVDFVTYWRHRLVHKVAWPYHTIHHAAREIHWTTTVRLHPGDVFLMALVRVPLMWVLGFDGPAMIAAEAIHHFGNAVNHLNLSLDWPGPLRYVLVSPNMHRWHHAADDPQAVDKNFAVTFAVWDVLFGTFYVPRDRLPTAYGVWDADGVEVVGPGMLDQLLYPLRCHARVVARWFGRSGRA